jgi:hypothetical protein
MDGDGSPNQQYRNRQLKRMTGCRRTMADVFHSIIRSPTQLRAAACASRLRHGLTKPFEVSLSMPEPSIRSGQGLAAINIRLRRKHYEHQTRGPQQLIVQLGLRSENRSTGSVLAVIIEMRLLQGCSTAKDNRVANISSTACKARTTSHSAAYAPNPTETAALSGIYEMRLETRPSRTR